MKKHVRNYFRELGYDVSDRIPCELCGGVSVDIHHVTPRSLGGSDEVKNLIALCRYCHDKAHNNYREMKPLLEKTVTNRK